MPKKNYFSTFYANIGMFPKRNTGILVTRIELNFQLSKIPSLILNMHRFTLLESFLDVLVTLLRFSVISNTTSRGSIVMKAH